MKMQKVKMMNIFNEKYESRVKYENEIRIQFAKIIFIFANFSESAILSLWWKFNLNWGSEIAKELIKDFFYELLIEKRILCR